MDDSHLLERVGAQDIGAFDLLYDRYAPLLFGVALAILANGVEAEETLIELFAQLWRGDVRHDPRQGPIDAWLLMMMRRRSLERLAILSLRPLTATAVGPPAAPAAPAGLLADRQVVIRDALGTLPVAQRQAIEWAYFRGAGADEIARGTGQSVEAAQRNLRAGLERLGMLLTHLWGALTR